MYADVATLEALQYVPLKGISIEDKITSSPLVQQSKDVVGCTAAKIAEQRSDVTPGWLEAFRQIVESIEMMNLSEAGNETAEAQYHPSHRAAGTMTDVDDFNDVDHFEDSVERQIHQASAPATNPGRVRSRTF